MPTINLQVAATTDDARNINSNGTFNSNNTTYRLGNDAGTLVWLGWRFIGDLTGAIDLSPLAGATITSAILDLFSAQTGQGTTAKAIIYGQDTDSTVTFSNTTANKPEGRARTSATTTQDIDVATFNATSSFGNAPISVTSIIQEIIDRPSWDGVSLVLIGFDNGSAASNNVGVVNYESSGNNKGAKLAITYTAASGTDIKAVAGVLSADVSKVSGVSEASISKVAGVSNA